jgi:hypothetical protein
MTDRLQVLEKELEDVKAALFRLQREVAELRAEADLRRHPVEVFLQQRGFPVLAHGDFSQLLLSPGAPRDHKTLLYGLLRRYSFRLFLRDLIRFPEERDGAVLSRFCSMRAVRSYLRSLADLGVVHLPAGGGYRLASKHVPSFGPTLEWYVCQIFEREFLSPAIFNVRLDNTRSGGDYDVVALLAGYLTYVEVKSSPPRGVELPAVASFLKRLGDLEPHLAVFLVDTELRMKDKIVPLFEAATAEADPKHEPRCVERLVDEIFHIGHVIYMTNSRKGIYSNIRRCVRDFLHGDSRFGPSPGAGDG